MSRAEDLHLKARRAANIGAYARATRYLDQATESRRDPGLSARIEVTRAYVEAETGSPRAGIQRCLEVLAREDLDAETRGLTWSQVGLIRMRTGESELAMEAFATAISVLPEGGEYLGRTLLNRGNVHLRRGDPRAAAEDFSLARDESARAGLALQQAKAEHNLGYARLLTGDLVGALQMIDRAALVLAPQSAVNRATIEQDRAEVLTAAGRPHEAVLALQGAAAAYGSRRLRTYQAECELSLAQTLLRQDPARARVVARRAARRFRGHASPGRALHADALALAAEISGGARSPATLARADELAAQLSADGGVRRRDPARAAGEPGGAAARRARRRRRAAAARPAHPLLADPHPPARTRGPRGARLGARGTGARARPCPGGTGRPARVAVLVREPRPAEHPGGPRPGPGATRPPARARQPRGGHRLRVVGAGPGPRRAGDARASTPGPAAGRRPHRAPAAQAACRRCAGAGAA